VRIIEDDQENAFASLGAQLMITRGLLDAIETQEELFFILGHEMMHLENRDPMRALLVHAPLTMSLALLGFDGSIPLSKVNEYFIKLKSREAEHLADV
jgi:predicted Zn-dependent protease